MAINAAVAIAPPRTPTSIHCFEPSGQLPGHWCRHCGESCGALTLLTSMARYYRCAQCGRSWQVTRADGLTAALPGAACIWTC